jgi:hypothetical protein
MSYVLPVFERVTPAVASGVVTQPFAGSTVLLTPRTKVEGVTSPVRTA